MSQRIVYLMRGLPFTGKSYTARRLAGDSGVVCETDEYFFSQVGEDPTQYEYRDELLEAARNWNFQRFCQAVQEGKSPIVVDRGNGLNLASQIYARHAVDNGYQVELKEPESEWWQEIRVLLRYKSATREILYQWADRLAEMSRMGHCVPVAKIRELIDAWDPHLTVEQILNYVPNK